MAALFTTGLVYQTVYHFSFQVCLLTYQVCKNQILEKLDSKSNGWFSFGKC